MAATDLAIRTTEWMDGLWDPGPALLWNPPGAYGELAAARSLHLVPQSAWYAVGLLGRDGPGDRDRAGATLAALCDLQYDEPGTPIHGTFARFLEWPHPPPDPEMWVDYDPNWRQFLGTTFGLVLARFGDRLDAALHGRLGHAVDLAVRGEPEGRVTPAYSNIALMKAWLDVDHGHRHADPELLSRGEALAAAVVERFDRHGCFDEHNSATYYGIDLYALGLWRSASASTRLRDWGRGLEAALWRDAARFYHAGLRNLAGPYTRSYTMDLTRSVGLLGVWLWGAIGRELAPLPALGGPAGTGGPLTEAPVDHVHDLCLGPVVALLGAAVPSDAVADFVAFRGERQVEQRIDDGRVASAWLGEHAMVGGEESDLDWGGWEQVHPATVHWRHPAGGVGWLRIMPDGVVSARAERSALVARLGPVRGRRRAPRLVAAPGPGPAALGPTIWQVPGAVLRVETDATVGTPRVGAEEGTVEVDLTPAEPGDPVVVRVEVEPLGAR